jgi:hypothetical protein
MLRQFVAAGTLSIAAMSAQAQFDKRVVITIDDLPDASVVPSTMVETDAISAHLLQVNRSAHPSSETCAVEGNCF